MVGKEFYLSQKGLGRYYPYTVGFVSLIAFFLFEDVYMDSISSKVSPFVSGMMKKQVMPTKILTQEYM